jgi:hypothetical protein
MPPAAPLPTDTSSVGPLAGATIDVHLIVLVANAGEAVPSKAAASGAAYLIPAQ